LDGARWYACPHSHLTYRTQYHGSFSKTPEEQRDAELRARETQSINAELVGLFDELARLPQCVVLEQMDDCERGLINVANGMMVVETGGGINFALLSNAQTGKTLELRTMPNSISGNYGTSCFTAISVDEARKLLGIWTIMAKSFG
jgi:hypothetical protein